MEATPVNMQYFDVKGDTFTGTDCGKTDNQKRVVHYLKLFIQSNVLCGCVVPDPSGSPRTKWPI